MWICPVLCSTSTGSAVSPESKLLHHASRPCYASSFNAGSGLVQHAIPSPWDTNLLDFQCTNDLVATLNTHIASAQQLLCYCARPLWAAVYIGRHQVAVPSLLCRLHITVQRRKKKKTDARGTCYLCSYYLYTEHGGKVPQDTSTTRVGFNCAFVQQNDTLACRLRRLHV